MNATPERAPRPDKRKSVAEKHLEMVDLAVYVNCGERRWVDG